MFGGTTVDLGLDESVSLQLPACVARHVYHKVSFGLRTHKLWLLLFLLITLNITMPFYYMHHRPRRHHHKQHHHSRKHNRRLGHHRPRVQYLRPKLILMTGFPVYYQLDQLQGMSGLERCNKANMKCRLTVNKDYFPIADAVIFYSHNKTDFKDIGFKPEKRPNTTWTYFAAETPLKSNSSLFSHHIFRRQFNSTMTYRMDSEFWHGNIRMVKHVSDYLERANKEALVIHGFGKKKKLAATFVNDCKTSSKRLEFLHMLQKYMTIDIYGSCGRLKCGDEKACHKMIADDYKFYLAFEESLCKDYIAKDLYQVMSSSSAVPVVRGGADYDNNFPVNSVVNTADFASAADLALHLTRLAEDEERWVSMLRWSAKHKAIAPTMFPFCEYCHSLYTGDQQDKLYDDVNKWWTNGACFPATDL